jgi:hypothetical protein
MPRHGQFVQPLLLCEALLSKPFLMISPFQFFDDLVLFVSVQKFLKSPLDDTLPTGHLPYLPTNPVPQTLDVFDVILKLIRTHLDGKVPMQRLMGPVQASFGVREGFFGPSEVPIGLGKGDLRLVFEMTPVG